MPAFIANAFPELSVEVVRERPCFVVDAAEKALGGTTSARRQYAAFSRRNSSPGKRLENLSVVIGDAAEFMASAAGAVRRGETPAASAICLDAFDGDGETPASLDLGVVSRETARRASRPGRRRRELLQRRARLDLARRRVRCAAALAREIAGTADGRDPEILILAALEGARERRRDARLRLFSSAKTIARAAATPRARSAPSACSSGDAGDRVRRAFWVEVVEDAESALCENEGAENGFPRVIRERPAGIEMNPLSALAVRHVDDVSRSGPRTKTRRRRSNCLLVVRER